MPVIPLASADAGPAVEAGLTSVLVVNFNAGALLVSCVSAVLASRGAVEVLVADNGSTDDSIALLEAQHGADPRLRIVPSGANIGFAAANNRLVPLARGDLLLLLNPDCWVAKDTIEIVRAALEARPRAGLAGCLVLNPDGSEQTGCRRAIPTARSALMRVSGLSRLGRYAPALRGFDLHGQDLPERPQSVEAISGAFMCARRKALEEVGLLDEGYFMHCEDLDWCLRFRRGGWEVLFVPDARVVHDQGTCSRPRPVRVHWHKHRGMIRFFNKFSDNAAARSVMPLAVWLRFAVTLPGELWRGRAGRAVRPSRQ